MYASEITWGTSEIFGRRRREGWLEFTVLFEIFLSLACSDIAHNRSPFTIKEPFWVCKLTMKDKAATCMTKYERTLSCVAIMQPCLWLWVRSRAGSVSATQWSQKPKKYADVSAHLEESVLWPPKKNQQRNELQIFRVQETSCDIQQDGRLLSALTHI